MVWRRLLYIVILLFVGGLAFYGCILLETKKSGRQVVYDTDLYSDYVGVGKFMRPVGPMILAKSRDEKEIVLDNAENLSSYRPEEYTITNIPAKDRLFYSVGRVITWEKIPGSKDEYIVVNEVPNGSIEKYRVAFAISPLFGAEQTSLGSEDVSPKEVGERNVLALASKSLVSDVGSQLMHKIIRRGDIVVILPAVDYPEYQKTDESGHYMASRLVVRRVGGKEVLDNELETSKNRVR